MATKTQHPSSFSRFSRIGFGLPTKSNPAAVRPRKNNEGGADEDWYIPYNGPYEPPRENPRKQRERDSWGDVLQGHSQEDDAALVSDLHARYSVQHGGQPGDEKNRVVRKHSDDGKKRGARARSHSAISGRTVSSGTVGPSLSDTSQSRRSRVSSTHRPTTTSYINLDASGGVGESPMPQSRSSKESSSMVRSSLFVFGGQGRRAPLESISRKLSRPPRSTSGSGIGNTPGSNPPTHRRSSSTGSSLNRDVEPVQPRRGTTVPLDTRRLATAEEDLYRSYYGTLINTPKNNQPTQPPVSRTEFSFPSSSSQHPYAMAEKSEVHTQPAWPRLTFTDASSPPQTSASADGSYPSVPQKLSGPRKLRTSVSTPDLRIANKLPPNRSKRLPLKPIGFKDRWLSPETWCDAVLFPRPRLKIKQEGELGSVGSGRIVSPPGTPLGQEFVETGIEPPGKEKGVASRVLVHSRSLADFPKVSAPPEPGPSSIPYAPVMPALDGSLALPQDPSGVPRPPRPTSFARDDMSLVPSLALVLEEGQLLDAQRKEWQAQATQSFQNKLSRDISRTRSKSLTQRGKRRDEPPPSTFDFLTTRACLGSQSVMPLVSPPRSQETSSASRHGSSSRGTFSRVSHSQSNSLSKTLSKSSKSHSHTHSRTDSWGKSALKVAKSAACGMTSADVVESDTAGGLESALRKDGTKVIRLADPAQIPVDKGQAVDSTSLPSGSPVKSPSKSPVPSTSSDVILGIALSTPTDALGHLTLPGHPYAQGGLYSYRSHAPSTDSHHQGSDYAGPHPSLTAGQPSMNDVSSRHRKPPQSAHPYAQVSRDSFFGGAGIVPQLRTDSDVPPPAKMWAQWSPGIVREILPSEIQYSPLIPDDAAVTSKIINDTTGASVANTHPVRPQRSKDSGLGTSEDHAITERKLGQQTASAAEKRIHRKPVQYDATRPSYLTPPQRFPDPSSLTIASSPLIPSSPRKQNVHASVDDLRTATASPVTTSASSSSPRLFGNPDDFDNYRDLFYRSSRRKEEEPLDEPIGSTSVTWEARADRPASSLTSLARQLSQEFHQMAAERDRESYYSHASTAMSQQSAFFRRPADSGLEFVFEEVSQSESAGDASPPDDSPLDAFHPSINIPEDVSRSSFQMDQDEDETEVYRVGIVESSLTPPVTATDHRASLTGDMSFSHDHLRHPPNTLIPTTVNSSLHPTSANPTRSSYLTSSSASRMSGLSDFPAPPKHHTPHMSLLSSFFDEALAQSDAHSFPPPMPVDAHDHRSSFGGDEEVEELISALSSQASHTSHTYTRT